jgi:sugar lactone lactonase YvrE
MGIASVGVALPVLLALLAGAPAAKGVGAERGRLDRTARDAYARKDYPAFLQSSRKLAELIPGDPRSLYNLACAQALTGAGAKAIATLDRIATMGVVMDAGADGDFASLKGTPAFDAVLEKMAALGMPGGRSRLAFTLPEKDLITEGIAHDPRRGDFFVSSVHRRKVLRVSKDGHVSDFVKEGQDGLLSALALAVDPAHGALFVSSEAMPMMQGLRPEDKGRSFVLEYGLALGKLRTRLDPPAGAGEVHLSDLAVGPDGTLVVSDPASGRVYVRRPGDPALQVLVDAGPLVSPQGLAWAPDGRRLFVADYVLGIARVDPASGSVSLLPGPANVALGGIDGLVFARGSLVGIQNGFRPHKVVRLKLDAEQSRIVEATVLERSNPEFDEPTLGVIADDAFYYVASSQYSKVRGDGSLDLQHLKPPVVLRMPLDWKD